MLACREHKGDPPRGDPPCAQNCAFDSFYVLKATQSKCLIYPNCSQISVGFTNLVHCYSEKDKFHNARKRHLNFYAHITIVIKKWRRALPAI